LLTDPTRRPKTSHFAEIDGIRDQNSPKSYIQVQDDAQTEESKKQVVQLHSQLEQKELTIISNGGELSD